MSKKKSKITMDPDFYSMKPITLKKKKKEKRTTSTEVDADEAKTASKKSESPPLGAESPKCTGG